MGEHRREKIRDSPDGLDRMLEIRRCDVASVSWEIAVVGEAVEEGAWTAQVVGSGGRISPLLQCRPVVGFLSFGRFWGFRHVSVYIV